MRYKEFGNTGKKLSVIGCGGTRYEKEKSIEENAERLLHAHSLGINHFDSSPGYNHYNCEDIVGFAIRQLPAGSFYTSSKDQAVFFKDRTQFRDKVKLSLDKIGVDKFDFYYIWNMKKPDEYIKCLSPGDQYEALLDLKDEGLIDSILLSSHLSANESIEIINDGKIEGILLNMNIVNFPFTIAAARKAKEKGIGIGVMSPLAGGLIPQNEDKFSFLAQNGNSPTYQALHFIASLPFVDFCYLATNSKKELEMANDVVNNCEILDDEDIETFQEKIGNGLSGACTSCQYCSEHCPVSIPVPAYMDFYNKKYLFGYNNEEMLRNLDSARKWFMLSNRKSDAIDCIECGQCEKECPQKLDIVNRMAYLGKLELEIDKVKG